MSRNDLSRIIVKKCFLKSFLKSTASGSDIVKLYDLTTLCEEAEEEKYQNPFTLPVAVLLYK